MKLALSTRASGDLNLSPVLLFVLLLFFLFPLCFAQIDSQEREKLAAGPACGGRGRGRAAHSGERNREHPDRRR